MSRREKLEARLKIIRPTLIELAHRGESIGNSSQYRKLADEARQLEKQIRLGA
jgi:hypothetical protein